MRKFVFSIANIFLLAIVFIVLYVINITLPLVSDDISMKNNAQQFSIGSPNFSFFHLPYFTHNARLGENLYFLLANANTYLLDILNAIFGTLYIFLFYFLVFLKLPSSKKDLFIFIFMLFFIAIFCPVSNFAWFAASFNYIWAGAILMLFALPFRIALSKAIKNENLNMSAPLRIPFYIIFFIISFFAGFCSELNIVVILYLLIFMIFLRFKKIKIATWIKIGFLLFIIGYACLYFSPGIARKSAALSIAHIDLFHPMSFFELIFKSLNGLTGRGYRFFVGLFFLLFVIFVRPNYTKMSFFLSCIGAIMLVIIANYYPILTHIIVLLLIFALLFVCIKRKESFKNIIYFLLLFLAFLCVGVAIFQVGSIPQRAMLMPYLCLIAILMLLFKMTLDFIKYKKLLLSIMICAILVCVCYTEVKYYFYNLSWQEVEQDIEENKLHGLDYVTIDKNIFIYGSYIGGWANIEDDNFAKNDYEKYYGLKNIFLKQ